MGWSTELFCNITFNKETYNSKYDVQQKIEDLEKMIQICKDNIRDLIMMTEPNKFCPENYDAYIWVSNEYRDNIDLLEEYNVELYKLNLLLDNWETCHNEEGLAINPPENITWKTAFLEGDFVNSVKYPKANSINE